jgi:serine/threonine protein phosphatase 1
VYAIGDVHGCDAQLAALLDHIAADSARRPRAHVTLVYLGDYVDRGPDSAAVLRMVATTPRWAAEVVALEGNHEQLLAGFLHDPATIRVWGGVGGYETLASFGVDVADARTPARYRAARAAFAAALVPYGALLAGLRAHHTIGDYYFCHAGVRPGVPLDQQVFRDLLWIRDEFLTSPLDHGKLIVHGHTAVDRPEALANRINVDTGAYASGRLTAVAIEPGDLRFLTVDATGTLTETTAMAAPA